MTSWPHDWRTTYLVEAWKTTVEVQKHFNDLELRIRNYALTLLLAVAGASGVALKEGLFVSVLGARVSLASCLLMAGLVVLCGFYFMDRFWYHRLLRGSVAHGQRLEQKLSELTADSQCQDLFDLTRAIGHYSPVRLWRWQIHSKHKMDLFYGGMALLLIGAFVVCLGGSAGSDRPFDESHTSQGPRGPAGDVSTGGPSHKNRHGRGGRLDACCADGSASAFDAGSKRSDPQ